MEADVPAYMRDLEKVADRIEAMFEWEALAQQERGSRALPPFVLSYKNQQEIADLYAQFSFICMSLHMMLDDRIRPANPVYQSLSEAGMLLP
ncbi:MAG: hypothetical protein HZA51_13075 [Planctomycetes bacterium]|nr:hypothetical protein [Planctomycetota bacterium]